ncbi:HNH endonuclease [Clostridiaceae bacterium UIB06]|uniref:HNH endonuclease n=1 Tax=Clostridium thailandense TaxID=2794346 RepID=A0A949TNM8_9CLOT|nr:HNH endonuclease domain-containing protein [Clostridium thailandense]MBV7273767.1 HNH endonuclease [Clostridium thailandense]MCH5137453.1 HNH endonuclease [Clostridiaceae bacterium UIB06]
MNNFTETRMDILTNKEIENNLPHSNKVESRIFSTLLDDDRVVASYKMYWLLGILDEVCEGKEEIEFNRIIARMIVYAWYPTLQYRLSFGSFDNLKKPINYIAETLGFKPNCDEAKLLAAITASEDKELQRMIKDLTYHVPYRLISPFFKKQLEGVKDSSKNKLIVELSIESETCLYKIIKDKIILNTGWADYLKENYRVIKSWIYYKIIVFLQKRNPNTPAVALKLEAPKIRKLSSATKLWNEIVIAKNIKDIYTGKEFYSENYEEYGVFSIDHFIPWSFVLHDQFWNLTPTFKNINSKKNDDLLLYDKYIGDFCDIQYEAFMYVCEKKVNSALEEYMDAFRLEDIYEFYRHCNKEIFNSQLKKCISPLYQIAVNQGFQVRENLL